MDGTATVTVYEPDRRAAWDVRFGALALHQAVDLLPEQGGAATRLRLSIEARARGPISLLLPLLRRRFQRTMTRSLATVESLLERST